MWRIRKGEETRVIDGQLINYYEYNWATNLYDGTNLIDLPNKQVLHGIQRLAFLAREMPGGPNTLTTFKNFLWSLNLLVRWTYLNGDVLKPQQFIFTKLTMQHFVDFFTGIGKGGVVFALQYPERILLELFPAALGRKPTVEELNDPLSLNGEDCCLVARWLATKGALNNVVRSDTGELAVNRGFLANLIGADVDTLRGGPRWLAFLEQFAVSDTQLEKRAFNNNGSGRREYPSQKAISLEEAKKAGATEKTLGKYFDDFRTIVSLHRHLPDVCPNPHEFKPAYLRKVVVEVSDVSNHTPWIPLNIAMDYTTEALRWVHVYGEDLVSVFLLAYRDLYERGLLVSASALKVNNPTKSDYAVAFKALSNAREQYIANLPIPESLRSLNLNGWGVYFHLDGKKGFTKLQKEPSLNDAIMVLIGAITVVISMVKPIRESELRALKTDCITFVKGDGYWLSQDIRKKNVGDIRPIDARPIPLIATRAIQLLRRLTDGLKEIMGVTDPWLLNSLMTLPSFGRYEAIIEGTLSATRLGALLDAFCDFVALPPNATGQRWYLRVHEMRKSFLITFFWTYRYASLDAARWMAGHADASHLYAYIQANFPGEELPGLEAEYAAQVLRDYEQSGATPEVRDVGDLYQVVCDHFSVRDVSWIDEQMLKDWLELQFESKEFQIIPYSIRTPDGGTETEIAFRVAAIENLETIHG
ncbi:hypothetical protein [Aeromonas rivipollensis]|uniref:hypothetical protein n=1 Tax=Aeromonas rivipollensis TaxID=948519 RepID=UPI001F2E52CF|nr:hypothetical protein [Aeromonas rivipollensis]MCE9958429.1 hypothetical protein [Aeromonas rivipollensis]